MTVRVCGAFMARNCLGCIWWRHMGSSWAWCWLKGGVGEKEGELTVAPELLTQGELAGRGVTGDALYAQQNLSRQVVEQGGYFWGVQERVGAPGDGGSTQRGAGTVAASWDRQHRGRLAPLQL